MLTFQGEPLLHPQFVNFVELVKAWYSEIDKNKKNNEYERSLSDIRLETTLLTLNNQEYSISDVMNWIDTHPLVFRDGYYKNINLIAISYY